MRFHVPTTIYFGSGQIAQVKEIAEKELGAKKHFLVTDKGIRESGIADKVFAAFPDISVFDGVEQNPKHLTVNKAGELVRAVNPELVIGLGGGSSLDAAKAVALLATNPGRIEDFEGKHMYRIPPLPVLAIPTTCGTGSEVTWVTVVTHTERKFKMSIKGPHLFPSAALVDPDLLVTLPPSLVGSTGLDALTHAIEAYTAKPATPITDMFALRALQYIFFSLEDAHKNIKGNKRAREEIMMGSLLAGMAFGNSDVGAVHCISEAVGSLYDTPHGVANALFLPYVMEFNIPVSARRYADVARLAGVDEKNDQTAARKLIQRIKDMSRQLKIPSIREVGLSEAQFLEIAQKSFANNSNPSNPREANPEDYLDILSRAFADS
jgi:alcohol dehydrogenase